MLAEPHPIVREIVEAVSLARRLEREHLDERDRSTLFRVICLHHWAVAHGVA